MKSFYPQTTNEWNKLPQTVVNRLSLNIFQIALKKHLHLDFLNETVLQSPYLAIFIFMSGVLRIFNYYILHALNILCICISCAMLSLLCI